MPKLLPSVVWLGGATLLAACAPGPASEPDDGGLSQPPPFSTSALVRFRARIDPAQFTASPPQALLLALRSNAVRSQGRVLALLRDKGIEPTTILWSSNQIALTAPRAVLDELVSLPEVESIEPDLLLEQPPSQRTMDDTAAWNLDMIRAPESWAYGYRGEGVVVAALDTGVDATHPDLAPSYTGRWFDPYGQHATATDVSGHGTQVMGLIVGGSSSGIPVGVAPAATWMAARVFNDAGQATLSGIHQAFQWVLDPDADPSTADAPHVVNASWGFADQANQCSLEFESDLALLRAAGIAVVFAGGNSGPGSLSSVSPANNPSAFAVGSVDSLAVVEGTSGRGPGACLGDLYPDLVAPGVAVRTTDLTLGGVITDAYVQVTGTSFAAPHVSGALALLRGKHPNATVDQLEQALRESAAHVGDSEPDHSYGNGLVDVVQASERLVELLDAAACADADLDGYFAQAGCGTATDCDDSNGVVNPGACDTAGDRIDQDCDGVARKSGPPCPSSGSGISSDGIEGKGQTCSDGVDNDTDGKADCADPGCASSRGCQDGADLGDES